MREGEGNGCRVVTDREGIRPDNGGGDGSKVVREEGPGRGAAVTVRGRGAGDELMVAFSRQ